MTEKINLYVSISASDDSNCYIAVTTNSGNMELSKFEAIKLRNFLNKFINGDFVEDVPVVEEKPEKKK